MEVFKNVHTGLFVFLFKNNDLIRMHFKRKKQEKQLNQFIDSLTNLSIFSPLLLPAISIDRTAKNSLKEIYRQTSRDHSSKGQYLHDTSGSILQVFEKVQEYNYRLEEGLGLIQNVERYSFEFSQKQKHKLKGEKTIDRQYERTAQELEMNWNNQNVNLMNIKLKKKKQQNIGQVSGKDEKLHLTELIRPEYRKKVNPHKNKRGPTCTEGQTLQLDSFSKNQHRHKIRGFLSSSGQYEDLPIFRYHRGMKRRQEYSSSKSERSVSPKVQSSKLKSNTNNVSSISRSIQVGPDLSFQIDLNSLGLVPERNIFPTPQIKRIQKHHSEGIEEEEPWECDEDEVEEQLRQINERLSHRTTNPIRFQTEQDLSPVQHAKLSPRITEFREKETKTVRLNLTPSRTQWKAKSQKGSKSKKAAARYHTESEHEEEIQCQKWEKRGVIGVRVRRVDGR